MGTICECVSANATEGNDMQGNTTEGNFTDVTTKGSPRCQCNTIVLNITEGIENFRVTLTSNDRVNLDSNETTIRLHDGVSKSLF